jgi:transposase
MKLLSFEVDGYCVWSKRLERGQFAILSAAGTVKRRLSRTEFLALLEGVDMVIKRQRKRYKRVA